MASGGGSYVVAGLASATSFGVGDFSGGLATRRSSGLAAATLAQLTGCVLMVGILAIVRPELPAPSSLLYGLAAGVAGGTGIAALYRGLATGAMGLVAAISGAGSVVVPLLASVYLLSAEVRPLQLAGVACALGAILAASGSAHSRASRRALALALLAALGFGLWAVLLDRAAGGGELWSLVSSRFAGTLLVAILAVRHGNLRSVRRVAVLAAGSGVFDVTGNALFVVARSGMTVGLAAALSGIYPLVTMLLARIVLRERLPRLGLLGVGLALASIILISLG